MSSIRQDAWSNDEDLLLAEVVLRHIREGSTQLAAFEEVGKQLARTAAACGFRWNSTIRKKYTQAVELAKKHRKHHRLTVDEVPEHKQREVVVETAQVREQPEVRENKSSSLTLEDIIVFLREREQEFSNLDVLKQNIEQLKQNNERLLKENELLEREIKKIQQEKSTISEDYQMLMSIMERARKLSEEEAIK